MTEHVQFLDRCAACGRVTDLSSALTHHCDYWSDTYNDNQENN